MSKILICFMLLAGIFSPIIAPAQESWAAPETSTPSYSNLAEPSFVLQNFYLSSTENLLTTRLALSINNLDYLRNILRDGARLSIECHSTLYRKRTMWPDAMVSEHVFSSSIKYNPLQRNFVIFSKDTQPITNSDLFPLLQMTWGKLEMPLTELAQLEKNEIYLAVISLTLKHEEFPPWLGRNVLFWSDIIIPSKEYQLEFEY